MASSLLRGREVGYSALAAVSASLQRLGCERVRLAVDDPLLVEDLRARNEIPAPLAVEYVRLRCRLNRFLTYEITHAGGSDGDLAARARSETAMRIAA